MYFRTLLYLILIASISCQPEKKQEQPTWIQLFNGQDLDGWTPKISGFSYGENYRNTFQVEDGLLKVNYAEYDTFAGEFGHLFYKTPYSSYKVIAEYKFTGDQVPGGPGWAYRNNGIMYHCQDPKTMGLDQDFPVCLEFQFLGGNGTDPRPTCNLCTPGTHVRMGDSLEKRHCINSTSKTYHGDQWVTAELIVYKDSVVYHIVEGDTVMTYSQLQIGGGSKPDEFPQPDGTPVRSGYLAIQAETHPIWFKRIDLLPL